MSASLIQTIGRSAPHDDSWYRPDFAALGRESALLRASGDRVNWRDPSAVCELNRLLLRQYLGLEVSLPADRLCPTFRSRVAYVQWIKHTLLRDLIADSDVLGLDVGTGASCVYPLVARALYGWRFVACEVDPDSAQSAYENVQRNGGGGIWVCCRNVRAPDDRDLDLAATLSLEDVIGGAPPSALGPLTFVMCNPPFFGSLEEKAPRADTRIAATPGEVATPGGEVAFIKRLIDETRRIHPPVLWGTSLVGRKSSLRPLLEHLRREPRRIVKTGSIVNGRTKRWIVAWSDARAASPGPVASLARIRRRGDRGELEIAAAVLRERGCAVKRAGFGYEVAWRGGTPSGALGPPPLITINVMPHLPNQIRLRAAAPPSLDLVAFARDLERDCAAAARAKPGSPPFLGQPSRAQHPGTGDAL